MLNGTIYGTIIFERMTVASVETIVETMKTNPGSIKFSDCMKVCIHYFGQPGVKGSHYVFKTPWKGEPWVNIQEKSNPAKPYQVRQILGAIDKLGKG